MDCYLINLDRSTDRLSFMQQQIQYLQKRVIDGDINLIRVPAIDAFRLSNTEIAAHYDRQHYSFNARFFPNVLPPGGLTKGEIACFYSHRVCWQQIVNSGKQYAAVLEDDIIFSRDADVFLSDTSWIPQNADIIKLEVLTKKIITDISPRLVMNGKAITRFYSSNLGTAAYIISKEAAAKLLKMTDRFYVPIDHVMFGSLFPYFSQLICYQVVPAICIQDSEFHGDNCVFKSTIDNRKEAFFHRIRNKMGLGIKIKRELIRFGLQVKSRAGIRKKTINSFNSEEAFLSSNEIFKGGEYKQSLEDNQAFVIKPYFKNKANAIVFVLDRGYLKQFAVMLQSIIEHAILESQYDLIVFENTFTEQDRIVLKAMCPNHVSIRFFDITNFIKQNFPEIRIYGKSWWTEVVWYKCFIPFLLKGYKKACCLDVDAIVQYDINELFNVDLLHRPLGAVRDVMSFSIENEEKAKDKQYQQEIGLKQCTDYFNGGMLLFDLEMLDVDQYRYDFLKKCKTNISFKCLEQDVLNSIFNQNVRILPFKYNFQVQLSVDQKFKQYFNILEKYPFESIQKSPKFIHFFSAIKPWHLPQAKIKYYDLFWKYAEKTPFYEELKQEANKNAKWLDNLKDQKISIRFSYWIGRFFSGLLGKNGASYEKKCIKLKDQLIKIKAMSSIDKNLDHE